MTPIKTPSPSTYHQQIYYLVYNTLELCYYNHKVNPTCKPKILTTVRIKSFRYMIKGHASAKCCTLTIQSKLFISTNLSFTTKTLLMALVYCTRTCKSMDRLVVLPYLKRINNRLLSVVEVQASRHTPRSQHTC